MPRSANFVEQLTDRQGKPWAKAAKSAVVPPKPILNAANVPIIGGHQVHALQSPPEGWQALSLLERCRERGGRQRACGAAARTVSGRDQKFAEIGVAAVD
jgi:hypothetical protein